MITRNKGGAGILLWDSRVLGAVRSPNGKPAWEVGSMNHGLRHRFGLETHIVIEASNMLGLV